MLFKIALLIISLGGNVAAGRANHNRNPVNYQTENLRKILRKNNTDNAKPSKNKGSLINVNYCNNNYTIYSNNTNI